MTLFILGALVMAGVAVALIAPALRGRRARDIDQLDHRARTNIRIARQRLRELDQAGAGDDDAARGEIELALLDDLADGGEQSAAPAKTPGRAATALILVSIPVAAVAIYLALGNPDALMRPAPATANTPTPPPSMPEMIGRVEEALAEDPDNAGHWAVAARAYMAARRFTDAERAYRTLHRLVGDQPDVLTAWADAAVMAGGGVFSAPVLARIDRALELAPQNKNALWLAAIGAQTGGDYRQALTHLQRLLPLVENQPQERAEVRDQLAKVQRELGAPPAPQSQTEAKETPAQAGQTGDAAPVALAVEVAIDPALAAAAGGGDGNSVVYVFARAPGGGPPLAVSRHRASEWPISLTLDDSMAMLSGLEISNHELVTVMARLSRSGDPGASPGDLESAAVVVRSDRRETLQLVIDRVVGAAADDLRR